MRQLGRLQQLLHHILYTGSSMYSIKPISQLRFDYDATTARLLRKSDMFIFCLRRIASNGSRRARYVVVVS